MLTLRDPSVWASTLGYCSTRPWDPAGPLRRWEILRRPDYITSVLALLSVSWRSFSKGRVFPAVINLRFELKMWLRLRGEFAYFYASSDVPTSSVHVGQFMVTEGETRPYWYMKPQKANNNMCLTLQPTDVIHPSHWHCLLFHWSNNGKMKK